MCFFHGFSISSSLDIHFSPSITLVSDLIMDIVMSDSESDQFETLATKLSVVGLGQNARDNSRPGPSNHWDTPMPLSQEWNMHSQCSKPLFPPCPNIRTIPPFTASCSDLLLRTYRNNGLKNFYDANWQRQFTVLWLGSFTATFKNKGGLEFAFVKMMPTKKSCEIFPGREVPSTLGIGFLEGKDREFAGPVDSFIFPDPEVNKEGCDLVFPHPGPLHLTGD